MYVTYIFLDGQVKYHFAISCKTSEQVNDVKYELKYWPMASYVTERTKISYNHYIIIPYNNFNTWTDYTKSKTL